MEPLQSENCLPTLGSMLDPKFLTTNSNTAKDGVMSTQIEKLADEFVEIIARQVVHELNTRVDLNTEYGERLAALEARLVSMENVLAAQPLVDKNFIDERIKKWAYENFDYAVKNIIDRYDMTGKIEDTLRDFDLGVEEAVEDEIRNRTLVTEDDLVEFLNDRVRITVE